MLAKLNVVTGNTINPQEEEYITYLESVLDDIETFKLTAKELAVVMGKGNYYRLMRRSTKELDSAYKRLNAVRSLFKKYTKKLVKDVQPLRSRETQESLQTKIQALQDKLDTFGKTE